MYKIIKKCRICKRSDLLTIISLGEQYLTGIFPKTKEEQVTQGPLDLMFCCNCSLVQLKQSYSLDEMYGNNYGYRSGLNTSMVRHLKQKIHMLEMLVILSNNDIVVDIGSNDATSLNSYKGKYTKVGIDPTGNKFRTFYSDDIVLIPDFFSADCYKNKFNNKKAKIITSISMFYDLENPINFVNDIYEILSDDGVWHFEQSYMPSMLRTNSYDTICHEHLEFYSLKVVKDILNQCGLRIIDVQMNSINGGSFAITACKENSEYKSNLPVIHWLLRQEKEMALETMTPYSGFQDRVFRHRKNLIDLIESLVADGKKIIGYGASTKGNVLLQFCGLNSSHIKCIAEVNEEKYGAFTPGTHIPIISEQEARKMKPDYFLVFPWHFKHNILEREKDFTFQGGKFIFPLPEIEII